MTRHNILITYRNFQRFKSSFLINVVGLSTGLACVLMIFLWVRDELRMNSFLQNSDRLYQVMENVDQNGGLITRESTSGPTAETLAQEFPEVEFAATATMNWDQGGVLSAGDRDVRAKGIIASTDFFRIFSFEMVHGDRAKVLADKKGIVISKSLAIRLFGSAEEAAGKTVKFDRSKEYHVTGVMADLPSTSSAQFQYALSFEGFRDENEWVKNWYNTAPETYVLLRGGADAQAFNKKIVDLVRTKTEGNAKHRSPFVRLYSDSYLYNRYENGKLAGGRIEYVKMLSTIAGFILLIACINFMNLSTAQASRRMKEIGVKKAIGARRGVLIIQYLSESLMMALIAMVVSVLIVFLLLPQFNDITSKQLTMNLDASFTLGLVGILIFTGLVAGSYPALYLSRFAPSAILKGKIKGGLGEVVARKGLVMFQFALSVILIVAVFVVYKQISFISHRNLGYDKDNIVLITREGATHGKEDVFIAEVEKIPGVIGASNTGHDMTGHNGGTYGVEWQGKDPTDRTEFERFATNHGLIELLGMEMKEGRSFSPEFAADSSKIIFNEAAIAFMNMEDPIGKKVKFWGEEMEIVGVVKDFNFESFHEPVKPALFYLKPEHAGNMVVKIEQGKEKETISRIESFYQSFNPGFPLNYHFLDDDYQQLYESENRVATLSKYFAGLAILISCLGLYGLAAFTAERRIKEIGIRKILGSSNTGIVYLLSREFTLMVIGAIVLAMPVSYFIVSRWLENFVFRISLDGWIFAGAGMAALVTAWITVGIQTFKSASVNPTECLKSE
jgi:putative ABC transport system permease protein